MSKYKMLVEMWFDLKTESDAEKSKLKKELEKLAGKVNGKIKVHKCYHDEPTNTPCEPEVVTKIGNGGFD